MNGGGGGSRTRVRESLSQQAYVRIRFKSFDCWVQTGKAVSSLARLGLGYWLRTEAASPARLISAYGSGQKPAAYPAK